jgi:hypothetical protein
MCCAEAEADKHANASNATMTRGIDAKRITRDDAEADIDAAVL